MNNLSGWRRIELVCACAVSIVVCCLLRVALAQEPALSKNGAPLIHGIRQRQAAPADSVAKAIRQRLSEYEQAWNKGDVQVVLSQYDPSLFAIWGSDQLSYVACAEKIEETMSEGLIPQLRLVPTMVRPVGSGHAIASGRVETVAKDGTAKSLPFTVIYMLSDGQWKLIHSHS